jgi:thermitase
VTGSRDVLVGIADTGLDPGHPDLRDNVRSDLSRDFVADGPNLSPVSHATHVAGIVGAVGNNGRGVTGVGWNLGLVDLHVIRVDGAPDTAVAGGFAYARQAGLRIVNASFGISGPSQLVRDAIAEAPNTLFVVTAGNLPDDHDVVPEYPCTFELPNMICVAASQQDGNLTDWTGYGGKTVDLAAPGEDILSTVPKVDMPIDDQFKGDEAEFEAHWSHGGTNDGWDRRKVKIGASERWALTSNAGTFPAGVDSYAQYIPAVDLSGKAGCMVWVTLKFDPGADGAELSLESTTDGSHWQQVGEVAPLDDPDTLNVTLFALPAGGRPSVSLRFHLQTPHAVHRPGFGAWIDEVELDCAEPGTEDYALTSGTSMAAPMVAGAAAVLLARNPLLTVAQLRDALLSSVTRVASHQGKTVTGGVLNLPGALAKVSPLGGETSQPTIGTTMPATTTPAAAPGEIPLVAGRLVARVTARRSQPISRDGDVLVRVRYDRDVQLRAAGSVAFKGGRARLRKIKRAIAADTTTSLKLHLRAGPLRRARAAYHDGHTLTARVTLRATDASGEVETVRRFARDRPR